MPNVRDIISTHCQYQSQLRRALGREILAGRLQLFTEEVLAVLTLNLDPIADDLIALYTDDRRGNPHDPMALFRSLLLLAALRETDFNHWAKLLRLEPTLAQLSGFGHRQPPSPSTFYAFVRRIADGPDPVAIGPNGKRIKLSTLRKGSRGLYLRLLKKEKEDKKKSRPPEGPINAASKAAGERLDNEELKTSLGARLSTWLIKLVVLGSAERGLLGAVDALRVSADGSIIESCANGSGHAEDPVAERATMEAAEAAAQAAATKNEAKAIRQAARQKRDERPRLYSDPVATWTWSRHLKRWVFGHRLHLLATRQGGCELPLYVSIDTANMADGVMAADDMANLVLLLREHLPEARVSHFIADTGYDAIELYRLMMAQQIKPVISLHPNAERSVEVDGVTYDDKGRPLCPGRLPMRHNDYNKNSKTHGYHCPVKRPTHAGGKYAVAIHMDECPLSTLCDTSRMGPFVRVSAQDDPRRHPPLPRHSAEYERIFAERTATERLFGRIKNDGGLGKRPYRSQEVYGVMAMMHALLIHARAHVVHDFGDVAHDETARSRALGTLVSDLEARCIA